MLDLLEVTTLLKDNGINSTASKLKVKKNQIYNFLKSNGLTYRDGEVKPIMSSKEIVITKVKPSNSKSSEGVIQSLNKDIDINALKELISLIEPIKDVIQEYNKNKNIVEIEKKELNPKNITEVKQKLFKIDVEVLSRWEKFVIEHKQYKVQNLISLALEEFIQKYSK